MCSRAPGFHTPSEYDLGERLDERLATTVRQVNSGRKTDNAGVSLRNQAITLRFQFLSIQFGLVRLDDECYGDVTPIDDLVAEMRQMSMRSSVWLGTHGKGRPVLGIC
jgi:hypothetical protein